MKNHIKAVITVALYVCIFALFAAKEAKAIHPNGRRHHRKMGIRKRMEHHKKMLKRLEKRKKIIEKREHLIGQIEDLEKRIAKLEEQNKEDLEKAIEQAEEAKSLQVSIDG